MCRSKQCESHSQIHCESRLNLAGMLSRLEYLGTMSSLHQMVNFILKMTLHMVSFAIFRAFCYILASKVLKIAREIQTWSTVHCATKSSLRISKIPTEMRPLSPCSGRSTGSEKPKNFGFQWWPPELHQGEDRGHLRPQGGHLEQSSIKAGGNKKL